MYAKAEAANTVGLKVSLRNKDCPSAGDLCQPEKVMRLNHIVRLYHRARVGVVSLSTVAKALRVMLRSANSPPLRFTRQPSNLPPRTPIARCACCDWVHRETDCADRQGKKPYAQAYTLTAQAGVEIARRITAGEAKSGFQTPSLVFGADFILQFEGVRREELNA
jgi:hypothetical protein